MKLTRKDDLKMQHVVFIIWFVCMILATIISSSTKMKRRKMLIETEDAKRRYLIVIGLFLIPTVLLYLTFSIA